MSLQFSIMEKEILCLICSKYKVEWGKRHILFADQSHNNNDPFLMQLMCLWLVLRFEKGLWLILGLGGQ